MLTTGIRAVFLSTKKISAVRKMFSTSQRYSRSLRIDSYHIPILANGFAVVNSPYTLNIKPLDPSEYIEDEDFLMIVKEGQEMPSKASARVSLDLNIRDEMRRIHRQDFKQEFMKNISYDRRVVTRDQVQFLEVSCQPQAKYPFPVVDISLCLEIPVQFNMMIKASQYADVYVSNLEGGSFHEITTELGNCYLSNLKATDVHVKTKGGDIICPSYLLAEFGTLETEGQGKISVEKLQGRKFCIDSEAGGVHAGSMYVSLGEVKTDAGPIKLGSIHGSADVKSKSSDISVNSVSGNLSAATVTGDIFLHLSQFEGINLKSSKGNIAVTLESDEPCYASTSIVAKEISSSITLSDGSEIEEDGCKRLQGHIHIGNKSWENTKKQILAQAKHGRFDLGLKDWFSSLQLGKK